MMTTQTTTAEQLQKENENLRNEIHFLKEQIEWFKRNIFGKRSEKVLGPSNEEQLEFEFEGYDQIKEVQKDESKTIPAHQRRKPNRNGKDKITFPADIPVETTVIDIPEEEKVCRDTGEPLVRIGEEVTHKLAHKPGSYFIKRIIRPKYAAPKNPELGVMTASLPDSLLPRCQADESLLADVLVKKYGDHLPLYRQSEILSRVKICITRQLLSQWVLRAGAALKPLHVAMKSIILKSGNVFVDETPVRMLVPGKGKTQEAYVWVLVGGKAKDPPYRIYEFFENRKYCNADELLKGYIGVLHSDKFGAYVRGANAKLYIWCPCWSHIRRKFFEAESGDCDFRDWILRKIRHLFMYEKVAWSRSPEERLKIRQEKEVPIIDEIIRAVKDRLINGKILPKSKFRIALGYVCGLIPYLKNYTKHPFARLDNNVAERAIRPLAIGRKNWLFVGNERGGEAAGIIYSLIQTCRGMGINPREYLEDVMRRLMGHPANKIHELLPDQWAIAKGLPCDQIF
jgi:transposase